MQITFVKVMVWEDDNDRGGTQPGPATTASTVLIYPVPFRPGQGDLHLEQLPADGSVDIYDLRGRRVWKGSASGQTALAWNGDNESATTVSSGRYFVVVRDGGGGVVEKRAILIVR